MRNIFIIVIFALNSCTEKTADEIVNKNDSIVTYVYNKINLDRAKEELFENFPINSSNIVLLGDSKTEGFPSELINDSLVKNRGISGNKTTDVLKRMKTIIQGSPKTILLEIGLNDISEGKSPEEAFSNFYKIANSISTNTPKSKLIVQSVLPTDTENGNLNGKINLYNKLTEAYCIKNKITFVDINKHFVESGKMNKKYTVDGVHLNIEGYKLWYDLIKGNLK